jgi:hypothetical protein
MVVVCVALPLAFGGAALATVTAWTGAPEELVIALVALSTALGLLALRRG